MQKARPQGKSAAPKAAAGTGAGGPKPKPAAASRHQRRSSLDLSSNRAACGHTGRRRSLQGVDADALLRQLARKKAEGRNSVQAAVTTVRKETHLQPKPKKPVLTRPRPAQPVPGASGIKQTAQAKRPAQAPGSGQAKSTHKDTSLNEHRSSTNSEQNETESKSKESMESSSSPSPATFHLSLGSTQPPSSKEKQALSQESDSSQTPTDRILRATLKLAPAGSGPKASSNGTPAASGDSKTTPASQPAGLPDSKTTPASQPATSASTTSEGGAAAGDVQAYGSAVIDDANPEPASVVPAKPTPKPNLSVDTQQTGAARVSELMKKLAATENYGDDDEFLTSPTTIASPSEQRQSDALEIPADLATPQAATVPLNEIFFGSSWFFDPSAESSPVSASSQVAGHTRKTAEENTAASNRGTVFDLTDPTLSQDPDTDQPCTVNSLNSKEQGGLGQGGQGDAGVDAAENNGIELPRPRRRRRLSQYSVSTGYTSFTEEGSLQQSSVRDSLVDLSRSGGPAAQGYDQPQQTSAGDGLAAQTGRDTGYGPMQPPPVGGGSAAYFSSDSADSVPGRSPSRLRSMVHDAQALNATVQDMPVKEAAAVVAAWTKQKQKEERRQQRAKAAQEAALQADDEAFLQQWNDQRQNDIQRTQRIIAGRKARQSPLARGHTPRALSGTGASSYVRSPAASTALSGQSASRCSPQARTAAQRAAERVREALDPVGMSPLNRRPMQPRKSIPDEEFRRALMLLQQARGSSHNLLAAEGTATQGSDSGTGTGPTVDTGRSLRTAPSMYHKSIQPGISGLAPSPVGRSSDRVPGVALNPLARIPSAQFHAEFSDVTTSQHDRGTDGESGGRPALHPGASQRDLMLRHLSSFHSVHSLASVVSQDLADLQDATDKRLQARKLSRRGRRKGKGVSRSKSRSRRTGSASRSPRSQATPVDGIPVSVVGDDDVGSGLVRHISASDVLRELCTTPASHASAQLPADKSKPAPKDIRSLSKGARAYSARQTMVVPSSDRSLQWRRARSGDSVIPGPGTAQTPVGDSDGVMDEVQVLGVTTDLNPPAGGSYRLKSAAMQALSAESGVDYNRVGLTTAPPLRRNRLQTSLSSRPPARPPSSGVHQKAAHSLAEVLNREASFQQTVDVYSQPVQRVLRRKPESQPPAQGMGKQGGFMSKILRKLGRSKKDVQTFTPQQDDDEPTHRRRTSGSGSGGYSSGASGRRLHGIGLPHGGSVARHSLTIDEYDVNTESPMTPGCDPLPTPGTRAPDVVTYL